MEAKSFDWMTVNDSNRDAKNDSASGSRMQKHSKFISTGFSILAHASVLVLIKLFHSSASLPVPVVENYVDLDYKQFDEVPQVVSRPVPQVTPSNEVPDKTEPDSVKPAEMQDQSSDIAGLQKEKIQKQVVTANTNTTSVPYYKVKPKYPREALESNVEGHVLMQIDILEDGSVENIKVTGGDKLGVFESAATRAVAKWKYKTFTDDSGKPVKKQNYLVRVDFKIKDEQQIQ